MRVTIGLAEVTVAVLTVVLSVGASWVAVKEQMATQVQITKALEESVSSNVRVISLMEERMSRTDTQIALLKEKGNQQEKTTNSYTESLNGLRKVLGELNVTLGRMDERLIGVEKGVKELKK